MSNEKTISQLIQQLGKESIEAAKAICYSSPADSAPREWRIDLELGSSEKHDSSIHSYEHPDLVRVIEKSAYDKLQAELLDLKGDNACLHVDLTEARREAELLRDDAKRIHTEYMERGAAMRETGDIVRSLYQPKIDKLLEALEQITPIRDGEKFEGVALYEWRQAAAQIATKAIKAYHGAGSEK